MADVSAIRQIFSVEGAAWTGTAILALVAMRVWSGLPQLLDKWLAWRTAKAEERSADWRRLREEIIRLSEAEKRCREDYAALHAKHMEVIERLTALEAYHLGQGRASQEAAGIIALERMKDKKPPEGK